MKRFVVSQLFEFIDRDDSSFREVGEEDVFDADTMEEAEMWISKQKNENMYAITDRHDIPSNEEEGIREIDFSSPFTSSFSGLVEFDPDDDWAEGFDPDEPYDVYDDEDLE
jgi:hypothetical protein